jgi:hypothetical protein
MIDEFTKLGLECLRLQESERNLLDTIEKLKIKIEEELKRKTEGVAAIIRKMKYE